MEAGEGFGMALVVFHRAPTPRHPGEKTFDDPAFRQQDEAVFRRGEFDHAKFGAFRTRRPGGVLSYVSLPVYP